MAYYAWILLSGLCLYTAWGQQGSCWSMDNKRFIVWVLTGLWHGAAWNYAIWGGYYAILLILEKSFFSKWMSLDNKAIKCLRWAITMFFVTFGWAIFMADGYTMQNLFAFLGRMLHEVPLENKVTIASMGLYGYLPYIALGALVSFPSA